MLVTDSKQLTVQQAALWWCVWSHSVDERAYFHFLPVFVSPMLSVFLGMSNEKCKTTTSLISFLLQVVLKS